ncbi:MAG: penicillin acylase family protein [Phycisphaerae bacterium]|nr:penicillin acylase family protein [Phycisphaerae bacterium]
MRTLATALVTVVLVGPLQSAIASAFPLATGSTATTLPEKQEQESPPLDATRSIPGLGAEAEAGFDSLAIPTIRAATFEDALRVQGFVHAQERFAQMDLMRRFAAGELAEIASALALSIDRQQRPMRLRAVARAAYERLEERDRVLLDAYTAGVNAGIGALAAPPPEYGFLKAPLTPWRSEDCLLIGLSMAAMLNDSARIEIEWAAVKENLSQPLIDFLRPRISQWDTPVLLDSEEARANARVEIPGPDVVDTRVLSTNSGTSPAASATSPDRAGNTPGHMVASRPSFRLAPWLEPGAQRDPLDEPPPIGSNGWVIGGERTKDHRAILVNDMHLQITVPGIWYRVSLEYTEPTVSRATDRATEPAGTAEPESRTTRRLEGISLPGVPGLISGSTGRVAWGFTNVEADFIDFVVVETDPADPSKYLVPGGSEPFTIERETLSALGGTEEILEVRVTRWGPIVATSHDGRPLAIVWTAMQPGGLDLDLLRMRDARNLDDALAIARAWRGPQQNVLIADSEGNIGWTIAGYLPSRSGFDGTYPTSWSNGTCRWNGERDESERPELRNPANGIIVTANQRTMPLSIADSFGRMWAPPERAHRIRELALAAAPLDEQACAAIQLDVQSARFMAWRDRLVPALEQATARTASPPPDNPAQATAKAPQSNSDTTKRTSALLKLLRDWNGEASVDTKAMGVIRGTRSRIVDAVSKSLVEAVLARRFPDLAPKDRATQAAAMPRGWISDESILRILDEHPAHLLPPGITSWNDLLVDATLAAAQASRDKNGLAPWGSLNASQFAHPLARAMPLLASSFSIPAHDQPGHTTTVRVAAPTFGASDRLIVSPGREAEALIATPTGQSANPTSKHYRDLHESWRRGEYLPLRTGAQTSVIRFRP